MADQQDSPMEESEDLFNFDELAATPNASGEDAGELNSDGPDLGTAASGGAPASAAVAAPPISQSDDLFDFDDLVDSPSAPSDEEVAALDDLLSDLPDLDETPKELQSPLNSSDKPESSSVVADLVNDAAADEANVLVRSARSPMTLIGIAVLAAVNLALIGVTWKSNKNLRQEVQQVAGDFMRQAEDFNEKTDSQINRIKMVSGPIVSDDPGQQQTFANVLEDFERGDYPLARRRLYSLLSIIDRLEPDARKDVESRARFFLADSLRLQALAEAEVTP